MNIRIAEKEDIETILQYDLHISKEELEISIFLSHVYICEENQTFIGWMRYNLFWDNTPFLNLIYILENFRGKGYGTKLITFWENQMRKKKYHCVMTSTASNETSQHFYKKLDYQLIGGFYYLDDPFELIFLKKFNS